MENLLLNIGAAYIRVSDERQDEYSPASQLSKIREYAAKEGYQIPDEYVYYDDGISGRSTRGRDEFKRMIEAAVSREHPFNILYVWKISRFSRNMEDSIIYKSMLEKKGVRVISVSEPISGDIYGKLMERFLEWEAQFYSERLSGDVKRGLEEKISRKEPINAPPFGYIIRDKQFYPDEESGAAEIVREVFRRYAAGEKQREIAVSLGNRGVRTKFGNLPENRWIDYMLANPCYVGKLRYSKDGTRHISKRNYNSEDILTVDGAHTPIISQELWNEVQERLRLQKAAYGKRARTETPAQFMLKGLVRCSACGSVLCKGVAHGRKGISSLQCHSYSRGTCRVSHSITLPKAEAAVLQGLRAAVGSKQFSLAPKKPKPQRDGIDYNKLIAVEERKLARAKEAYLAEIDTLEQYRATKAEVEAKIAELVALRDKSEKQDIEIDVEKFAKKVQEILIFVERDDVTAEAKNEALRTIIEKIVYEKANGNLAIYFHDIS